MQIEIKLLFGNPAEALEQISGLIGSVFVPPGYKLVPQTAEEQKATAEAMSAPTTPEPSPTDIVVTSEAPPAARTPAEVITAVQALSARSGLPAVRELLTTFGVARVKDLKVEQYNEFIVAAQAK